jgi:hypothetical protein
MNEWAPQGKDRKYARVERERRFLLKAVPEHGSIRCVEIVDRYLDGSRVRLRAATTVDGKDAGSVQYKLTQKLPAPDGGPGLITTFYLDSTEHRLFDSLPGAVLRKTRLSIAPFGVDSFRGALAGLVLAEVEFISDEEMAAFGAPAWVGAEVTRDTSFSGGRLAHSTRDELRRALGMYGMDLPTATPQ